MKNDKELVRYEFSEGVGEYVERDDGEYVRYDQAAEMIAAKDAEISRFTVDECEFGHKYAKMKDHPHKDGIPQCPNCLSIGLISLRNRAETAENELAQIKKQNIEKLSDLISKKMIKRAEEISDTWANNLIYGNNDDDDSNFGLSSALLGKNPS